MKKLFLIFGFFITVGFATPKFPILNSSVVDTIGLLSLQEKKQLVNKLKINEENSSNQIVVVIIKSLDSEDINSYGYQLGRYWKIGQKDKNNGVLLIIAMDEHKIRIEVGYGLEAVLSDAIASDIINSIMVPKFRQKDFYKGINSAIDSIIKATKDEYKISKKSQQLAQDEQFIPYLFMILIFIQIFISKIVKEKKLKRVFSNIVISFIVALFIWVIFHNIFICIGAFLIVISILLYKNKKKEQLQSQNSSTIGTLNNVESSSRNNSSSNSGFTGGGGSFGGAGSSGSW
jgi:uncharacterized protein